MNLIIKKYKKNILSEGLLTEGLGDIGLTEREQSKIIEVLSNTSEKTNAWFGRFIKSSISIKNPIYSGSSSVAQKQKELVNKIINKIYLFINENSDSEKAGNILQEIHYSQGPSTRGSYKAVKKYFKSITNFLEKYLQKNEPEVYQKLLQYKAPGQESIDAPISEPSSIYNNKNLHLSLSALDWDASPARAAWIVDTLSELLGREPTVLDLIRYSEIELLKTKHFGRKAVAIIKDTLEQYGLELKPETGDIDKTNLFSPNNILGYCLSELQRYQVIIFDETVAAAQPIVELLNFDERFIVDLDSTFKAYSELQDPTVAARYTVVTASRILLARVEDEQRIVLELENGFYWYNTNTGRCPIEQRRLSHCGQAELEGSTLLSLRKKITNPPPSRRAGPPTNRDNYEVQWTDLTESYITVEYNEQRNSFVQIKAYGNSAPSRHILLDPSGHVVDDHPDSIPKEEYEKLTLIDLWEMIAKVIDHLGVTEISETGLHVPAHEKDDFIEMGEWLEQNSTAVMGDSQEELDRQLAEIEREAGLQYFSVSYELSDHDDGAYAYASDITIYFDFDDADLPGVVNNLEDLKSPIAEYIEYVTSILSVQNVSGTGNTVSVVAALDDYFLNENNYIPVGDPGVFEYFIESILDAENQIPRVHELAEHLIDDGHYYRVSQSFVDFLSDGAQKLENLKFVTQVEYDENNPHAGMRVKFEKILVGNANDIYDSLGDDNMVQPFAFYGLVASVVNRMSYATGYRIMPSMVSKYNRAATLPLDFKDKGKVDDSPDDIEEDVYFSFNLGRHRNPKSKGQTVMQTVSRPDGRDRLEVDDLALPRSDKDKGDANIFMDIYITIKPDIDTENLQNTVGYIKFLSNNASSIADKSFNKISEMVKEVVSSGSTRLTESRRRTKKIKLLFNRKKR